MEFPHGKGTNRLHISIDFIIPPVKGFSIRLLHFYIYFHFQITEVPRVKENYKEIDIISKKLRRNYMYGISIIQENIFPHHFFPLRLNV